MMKRRRIKKYESRQSVGLLHQIIKIQEPIALRIIKRPACAERSRWQEILLSSDHREHRFGDESNRRC